MSGPIQESKSMGMIFQKKGQRNVEKWKNFENLGKNVLNLKKSS